MYYDAILTGKRIQKLRKSQGLTQEQLAEELNISAVHMSKIEIGKRSCSLDVLAEIAVFFGASLDYLVLGKSTEKDLRGEIDAAIRTLENLRNSL
jgi:transcriptional regulator with XRE-family HTH domain